MTLDWFYELRDRWERDDLRIENEALRAELAELRAYRDSTNANLNWASDEIAYLRAYKESTEAALRELSRRTDEHGACVACGRMPSLRLYREPQQAEKAEDAQ